MIGVYRSLEWGWHWDEALTWWDDNTNTPMKAFNPLQVTSRFVKSVSDLLRIL